MVRTIVESVPGARFDRGHLPAFAESALEFEIFGLRRGTGLRRLHERDPGHQSGICRAFAREGIAFAFPTRTIGVRQVSPWRLGQYRLAGLTYPQGMAKIL